MRLSEARKGMEVEDRWFPENGTGTIISMKDNEIRVKFNTGIKKYNVINLANLQKKG